MRLVALTLLVAAGAARTPGIFQAEVLALENCSCVAQFGGGPLSRLYNLDARNAARSGLNHQYSNLKAVLGEGLGLGRAVLLGPPPLTLNHNFGLPFLYHRWSDFLSFERSTFRVVEQRRTVCEGSLASCVADVSKAQLSRLLADDHGRAAKESEIPNFKGSYLGRFPLVSADFWTSDHMSVSNRGCFFRNARARNTHIEATLNRPFAAQARR